MEKNNTLLTGELYKSIINDITDDVLSLKSEQVDTIEGIKLQKATLKKLRKILKETKRDIKLNKKALWGKRFKLIKINNSLDNKHNRILELNGVFSLSEERYIDLNIFYSPSTKKR